MYQNGVVLALGRVAVRLPILGKFDAAVKGSLMHTSKVVC